MAADRRRHVLLVGLEVTDESLYSEYRAAMTPILKEHGGDFAYDFVVSRVLRSEAGAPMNRVFAITFPDAETAKRFFEDASYLAVRRKYFEPAVGQRTNIAAFDQ